MTAGKTPLLRSLRRGVLSLLTLTLAFGALALGAGCGGSTDDRPATWTFVSTAILEPSCATANCHSAITNRASVDLSNRDVGYNSLIDRHFVIPKVTGSTMTDDERVARSPVAHLMRAEGNLRMPPDLPLPEIDILLFEKWIRAGAAKD